MQTMTPTSRLVQILTEEKWTRANRNSVARRIATMRDDTDADHVTRVRQVIERHGVVGRYDQRRAELLRVVAEANGCVAEVESRPYTYQGKRREYVVRMYGFTSDITRSQMLYQELLMYALAHMTEITGTDVLVRRRNFLSQFIDTVSQRLRDVGAAPSLREWIQEHRDSAAALRDSVGSNGAEHRERM